MTLQGRSGQSPIANEVYFRRSEDGNRGRQFVNTTIPRAHNIEDLDALLDRLRRETVSPDEIRRRRRVAAEVDRLRQQARPIPVPIEDLILREQGE